MTPEESVAKASSVGVIGSEAEVSVRRMRRTVGWRGLVYGHGARSGYSNWATPLVRKSVFLLRRFFAFYGKVGLVQYLCWFRASFMHGIHGDRFVFYSPWGRLLSVGEFDQHRWTRFERPLLILWPFGPVALVYDELDTTGKALPRDVRSFYAEGPVEDKRIDAFRSLMANRNIYSVMTDEGEQSSRFHPGAKPTEGAEGLLRVPDVSQPQPQTPGSACDHSP